MKAILVAVTLAVSLSAGAQVRSVELIANGLPNKGPDGYSTQPVLSGDGSTIAFHSASSNLTGDRSYVDSAGFVMNRATGDIRRFPSASRFGLGQVFLSYDGRKVAYDKLGAYWWDRSNPTATLISILPSGQEVNGRVRGMDSAGKKVLLAMFDESGSTRFYIRDIRAAKSILIQTNSEGRALTSFNSPILTGDGKWVYFRSGDKRLPAGAESTSLYRKRLADGAVERLDGPIENLVSLSHDGEVGITNGSNRFSVVNFRTGRRLKLDPLTVSARLTPDGTAILATLSSDWSNYGLGRVARFDLSTGNWTAIGPSRPGVRVTSITANGQEFAFGASEWNGDFLLPQIFVSDLAGNTEKLPNTVRPGSANGGVGPIVASSDGRYVAFISAATNLVEGVTEGNHQVFVRNVAKRETTLGSASADGTPVRGQVKNLSISADGRYLTYWVSRDSRLESGTVVVRDLVAGRNARTHATSGRVAAMAVKNNGDVAYSTETNSPVYPVAIFFLELKSGTETRISDQNLAGDPWSGLTSSLWVTAGDDRVMFGRTSTDGYGALMEWKPGETIARVLDFPLANASIVDLSDDANQFLLVQSQAGQPLLVQFERQTQKATPVELPDKDALASGVQLSGNGRFIVAGRYIFDVVRRAGWTVDGNDLYPAAIFNGADPVYYASDSIGGFEIRGVGSQPVIARLGLPVTIPETFLTGGGVTSANSVTVQATGFDWKGGSGELEFEYRVGAGDWVAGGRSPFTVPLANDGDYEIFARARRKSGEVDDRPAKITVTRDTVAPRLDLKVTPGQRGVKLEVSSDSSATWGSRVYQTVGYDQSLSMLARFSRYAPEFDDLVPDTEYSYVVTAVDAAGNRTELHGTFRTLP